MSEALPLLGKGPRIGQHNFEFHELCLGSHLHSHYLDPEKWGTSQAVVCWECGLCIAPRGGDWLDTVEHGSFNLRGDKFGLPLSNRLKAFGMLREGWWKR
jgi:hypothetical protein